MAEHMAEHASAPRSMGSLGGTAGPRKVVMILTDTQPTWFVGAYGNGDVCRTPNLDRLAAEGVRFDRGYTACPLCTPARSTLMTGLYPASNGAVANETSPARHIPMIGERLRAAGVRYGYTGKWHLDAAGYHGAGQADGGAPEQWWFDGRNYIEQIGKERYQALADAGSRGDAEALRRLELREEECWGYQVVERARDFLENTPQDEDFLFIASFDEPHGPFICPPEYFEHFQEHPIPAPANHGVPEPDTRPSLQRQQSGEYPVGTEEEFAAERAKHMACNAWLDTQIGRLLETIREIHGHDVLIIFTSDHGDMHGAHGLRSKGAMMYEETVRVPFIVRPPRAGRGAGGTSETSGTCDTVVSQIDLVPTILSYLGMPVPPALQGYSLLPYLGLDGAAPETKVHAGGLPPYRMIQFFRFGAFHRGHGEWYPIRCVVASRWKLVINLFDEDEFYDLTEDPWEEWNLLPPGGGLETRDALREAHAGLLGEMERSFDPLRGPAWRERPWAEKSTTHGRLLAAAEPAPGSTRRSYFGEQDDEPPALNSERNSA